MRFYYCVIVPLLICVMVIMTTILLHTGSDEWFAHYYASHEVEACPVQISGKIVDYPVLRGERCPFTEFERVVPQPMQDIAKEQKASLIKFWSAASITPGVSFEELVDCAHSDDGWTATYVRHALALVSCQKANTGTPSTQ